MQDYCINKNLSSLFISLSLSFFLSLDIYKPL